MSAEPAARPSPDPAVRSRIECNVDNDARLLASLAAVMAYAAARAGLPEESREDFTSAAAAASREMAGSGNGSEAAAESRLVIDEFSDRLEMTIDGLAASKSQGICKQVKAKAGERVRCEMRDGRVLLTLLKPCAAGKSGSGA